MKKTKRFLALLLAASMTFGNVPGTAFAAEAGTKPADGVTEKQPFASGTGGSKNFRIPCLVSLNDNTIVAGCDARWTTGADAGGLDTIVSRSTDNGETWNYTFANYLGDNGNVYNPASTAFIDPALATDGKTIYMIADLYPAGYAINSANHTPPIPNQDGSTPNGLDEEGNLMLFQDREAPWTQTHVLKEKENPTEKSYYEIFDMEGNLVSGYTVDAYFNITGNGSDSNLFFADAPFYVYPTDYLYLTTSNDGGASWSVPHLVNVKDPREQCLLVGPGRGLVTSKGRIIFTAYSYTGRDGNSSCFYSDNGGETWERGDSVSSQTSEATVVEANGKLFMFTRHGGYWVSNDWGQTWSEKKTPQISYNLGCQLSAITYSKKIDGKDAILLSAPSSTTSRSAGKIFVGLVQDDDSINWAYEYSVNGSAYYAYSCLTELTDGSIGLLYENAGAAITYTNIPITDIAKDAVIGNFWLTDKDNSIVNTINMKPGEEVSLTLNRAGKADGNITVTSDNEDAATAAISENTVTVTANENIEGLKQVTFTIRDNSSEAVFHANITAEEQYEIVNLHMGETTSYKDYSGDYSNTDLSGLDTNVANVTLEGKTAKPELLVQLGSAIAAFNGQYTNISDCLYTFTSTGTDNQYTISNEMENGTTAYLHHYWHASNSNGYPNHSTQAAITVGQQANKPGTFTLQDSSKYLYFQKAADKLYYDKNDNYFTDGGNDFELFAPSAEAPEDSPIKGYKKLNALSDIQNGEEYLIAMKGADNKYYVLYPSLSTTEKFRHVAVVTEKMSSNKPELGAQLASGIAKFDVEELIAVKNCLYTFTAVEGENNFTISGRTTDGKTVYLHQKISNPSGLPNQTTSSTINVVSSPANNGTFTLEDKDTSVRNGGFLYFHKSGNLHFDRNSSRDANGNCDFELFTPSESAEKDSPIPGYEKVTTVENGGQYLIASKGSDNSYYVLCPTTGTEKFHHVAKITNDFLPDRSTYTTIHIEAVNEGETSVKIGDTTYFIIVKNDIKEIKLTVGEHYVATGELMKKEEGQTVASIEKNTLYAPYAAVERTIPAKEGKYLIGNTSHILNNSSVAASGNNPEGLGMTAANFQYGNLSDNMWTIKAVEGEDGYTIQHADGRYLNFSAFAANAQAHSVTLSENPQTLQIVNGKTNGYGITNGTHYLNNFAETNTRAAAWNTNDNNWYFYQPTEGYVITGLATGETSVIIGGVTYHVTVTETEVEKVALDDAILKKNTKSNSQQIPVAGKGGPASYAFDDEAHWWHSRWQGTPAEGEAASGVVSANNPIWIQTGFDKVEYIVELTYLPRQDEKPYGRINAYEVQIANMENPTDTPTDEDFITVKEGNLQNQKQASTITLDSPTAATHIRLVAKSVYTNSLPNVPEDPQAPFAGSEHVAAQRIKIFAVTPDEPIPPVTLTGITVTPPTKIEYEIGEQFDSEGMVVTATYSDNTTKDVTKDATVEGFDSSTAGEKTITVTYENQTETFNITVKEPAAEVEKVALDDEILKKNTKSNSQQTPVEGNGGPASYAFDDEAHWWHSRWKGNPEEGEAASGVVSAGNPIWIQTGFDKVEYIIELTYLPRQDAQPYGRINAYEVQIANMENPTDTPTDEDFITVKEGNLQNQKQASTITLDSPTAATHIRLVAKSVYTNSLPNVPEDPQAPFAGSEHVAAQRIKIFAVTPDEPIPPVTLTGITVTPPTKIEYEIGEQFDSEGMVVTATYSNNTTKDVTKDATVEGFDSSTSGEKTITVTYQGKTDTFTVTVKEKEEPPVIELTGITVTPPTKIEYEIGEQFDSEGMVVTATYSNNTTKNVTKDATVEGFDSSTSGEKTITVTYQGKTDTFTVTVTEKEEPKPPVDEVNKETLNKAIEAAKELNAEDYTEDTWNVFAKALEAAKKVAADKDAKQKDVDEAVKALKEAKEALEPAKENLFDDVRPGDWYYDEVFVVNEAELMTGLTDTHFGALDTLVRAQFAVILHRIAGEPKAPEYTEKFKDVPADQWYTDAIMWAASEGIITGYENGSNLFGTNDAITREQMATIMYRYANTLEDKEVTKDGKLDDFPDANKVSGFAKEALAWCVEEKIITGDKGNLNPQGSALRAECAAVVARFYHWVNAE